MKVELTPTAVLALAGVVVGGFVVFKVYKAGEAVGDAIGSGASALYDAALSVTDAAWHGAMARDGAVGTVVGAAGSVVGLPTPMQTLDDPAHVRYIIDNTGMWEASKWGTAWAFLRALNMPAGTGRMPPPGTDAARALRYTDFGTGNGW